MFWADAWATQHKFIVAHGQLRYSTFTGERESRPFREERETADSRCGIVIFWLSTFYTHFTLPSSQLPVVVRILQQVEGWSSTKEENDF